MMPSLQHVPGAAYGEMLYPGVFGRDQAQAVVVGIGQEVRDVTFHLTPVRQARVSGIVLTSRGTPATDVSMMVSRENVDSGFAQATVSNRATRDGTFNLSSLTPGDYLISVQVETDGGREVGTQRVQVWGEDATGVTIVTGTEARLAGAVRTESGAPLPVSPGTPVRIVTVGLNDSLLTPSWPGSQAQGSVGADGRFSLPLGIGGSRLVRTVGLPSGWGIAAVVLGDQDVTDTLIDFRPGIESTVQIVVTNRLANLAGSVVDQEGHPTWDYRVVLFPNDPARWQPALGLVKTARPNQLGQFALEGVRPGAYFIAAVDGGDVEWSDAAVLESLKAVANQVTLAAGETRKVQMKTVRVEGR
jgi:hypothetical protein